MAKQPPAPGAPKTVHRLGCLVAALVLCGCSGSDSPSAQVTGAQGQATGGGTHSTSTAAGATPAALSSASSATPSSRLAASGDVDVLTYNVAGLPPGFSTTNAATNTRLMSPMLNTYDLVLVQEDYFYHPDLLQQALHPFSTQPQRSGSRLVNDGLNRFSEFPYADFTRVTWSACFGSNLLGNNDCLASKGYSYARHKLAPNVEVDVYNLHADAGSEPGDTRARTQQFAQLTQDIQTRSAGRALLVGGDLNLSGWRAQDVVILDDFMAALGLRDSARAFGMPERLDRILVRNGGDVVLNPTRYRLADEFVDSTSAPLSDHEAVHVELHWELYR